MNRFNGKTYPHTAADEAFNKLMEERDRVDQLQKASASTVRFANRDDGVVIQAASAREVLEQLRQEAPVATTEHSQAS